MKIAHYHKAKTSEEAYELLTKSKNNKIIGGGTWLRMMPSNVDTLVDLSELCLDYIDEYKNYFEIGSMTTLRQVEKNELLNNYYDGLLSKSINSIMNVAFRNVATIGGSISGKYGFSDLLTPLLAIDTELVFYKLGKVTLESFLNMKTEKDILLKVIIYKKEGRASFNTLKKTSMDYSVLNTCITKINDQYKIVVGARPGVAVFAKDAMKYINNLEVTSDINEAAKIASNELKFGTNTRASNEYRKEICNVFVKRGIKEVMNYED